MSARSIQPRILNYWTPPDPPHWYHDWAQRLPWLLTGGAGFCALALLVFFSALWFRLPDLMAAYPAIFVMAVLASADQRPRTRSLGIGAVLGSLFMSTVGYAAGLLIMAKL